MKRSSAIFSHKPSNLTLIKTPDVMHLLMRTASHAVTQQLHHS